ncbi:plant invertase/pectin methylesterase inhibitor [Striga asiatica]|uniref:pectinesterase n=1 Tax=Striga asiatica TaxID=4170 RepID=A0A5A7P4R2_STRAF|nr:plant invertase/pectin methylesterase inhibitor [Striga asiatica]
MSLKLSSSNKQAFVCTYVMASQSCPEIFMAIVFITTVLSLAASRQNTVEDSCKFTSTKDLCDTALFPDSCHNSLTNLPTRNLLRTIFERSAHKALTAVSKASSHFSTRGAIRKLVADRMRVDEKLSISALKSCATLLSLAIENINDSLSTSKRASFFSSRGARVDVMTWMSAAGTDLRTCMDEFQGFSHDVKKFAREELDKSTEYISNSLAIVTRLDSCLGSTKVVNWVDETKNLLDANTTEIKINLVVAQDSTGNFTAISDALKTVPDRSLNRFVIYVKKGTYYENVRVEKSQWNVMMIGEGMEQTVVSGNLSYAGGTKTFMTATFAVFGRGFVARQMAFRNTAPASQAVALLSTSDKSVFFQCLVESKQDTLYVHSKRQFYRECTIIGTMDFIFGNSATVIQTSLILLKNPSPGRTNVITAQGKSDPNENTGFSVHNCTIRAAGEKGLGGAHAFLGRPWRDYSTVVFMQTYIDGSVDSEGWLAWDSTRPGPNTVFYGEYGNSGPGANTSGRVKWAGVKVELGESEAEKFTVGGLIGGQEWLPESGVPFGLGLLKGKSNEK